MSGGLYMHIPLYILLLYMYTFVCLCVCVGIILFLAEKVGDTMIILDLLMRFQCPTILT